MFSTPNNLHNTILINPPNAITMPSRMSLMINMFKRTNIFTITLNVIITMISHPIQFQFSHRIFQIRRKQILR
ncbi:hypothetical protein IE02_0326 [Fibrobacter succinogenes subsp. elongatus]|uniref:Uncharacterized protein n=1 Tax=Fibrobacter succinogenes TaxID=833 RepID=A0A380RU78_FIBSU|nr:hypothetical protein IE02_0326 [Fibrobacter succinogenes subsp. elongatus]SUQ19100.1 hypothetical protein SAMN05661053_0326 [Fibrobacter succinogenes]